MRRQLAQLLRRFHRDERGAFLVLFAILAIVLIATSGAVVDFVGVEQARTRAQVALDAAALALQPSIYTDTPTQLKAKAQALVRERVANPNITVNVTSAVVNTQQGEITLSASLNVPTMFVSLLGINTIGANIISEATRRRLYLEVAFVLDNSNSMKDYSRMTNLISATKCAVNVLFNSSCASTATTADTPNVKIAIVPFTMQVNVGTANASATWLDRVGYTGGVTLSEFDNDNDDSTPFTGPLDRISRIAAMTGRSWGGCVMARKHPYDTQDDAPVAGTQTMYTPLFAPDERGGEGSAGSSNSYSFINSYITDAPAACPVIPTWTWTQTKTGCSSSGTTTTTYNNASCTATANAYVQTNETGATVTAATTQPATLYNNAAACDTGVFTSSGTGSTRINKRVISCTYDFSTVEYNQRICKYTGTSKTPSQAYAFGPNADCPTNPILPLSATKSTVVAAVNLLAPQGGTNIHAGTEWGFHVLSPGVPFAEGRNYDEATAKVMIVMTDGENTAYQAANILNTSFYSYYGYPSTGWMGTSSWTGDQLETEMNRRLALTCTNAKAAGIVIYTVGLNVEMSSAPTTNRNLLIACSSGTGFNYFPTQSSELTTVFETIALQLADLRLAQ